MATFTTPKDMTVETIVFERLHKYMAVLLEGTELAAMLKIYEFMCSIELICLVRLL
jgi:hypothetical protein